MMRDESDALDARLDAHLAVFAANRTGRPHAIDRTDAWSHVHPVDSPSLRGAERIAVVEPGEDEMGVMKRILGYRMNGTIPKALYEFATPHLPKEPESKPAPRNPDAPRGKVASSHAVRSMLSEPQQAIVSMALESKRFACWSDCGLGKTASELANEPTPEPVPDLPLVPELATVAAIETTPEPEGEPFSLSAAFDPPRARRRSQNR